MTRPVAGGRCSCPTNALHPARLEGGLNALWSPKLIARNGYCEWDCNCCDEVCPIPDKATYFVRNTIALRGGMTHMLRQPTVDPNLCTGCGI